MEKKILIALFIGIVLGLIAFIVVSLNKKTPSAVPGIVRDGASLPSSGKLSDFESDFYADLLEYFDGNLNVYEQVGGDYGFVNMEALN
ncbi:MAG: hypothetical protein LBI53_04225 [Candidatus Peribacteria bacterium]|jgi:hypothetical protein|nr:hypothetical protein [Candidatus Peribacteria bacterium]